MTVSSATNKVQYNGNGSTTVFAYTFKIFNQNDLTVIVRSAIGTETVKTITTHYTVSGVGGSGGGNVTMLTAPASGETLTVLREQDLIQELDLVENDPFPAQSLEDALDKLTFMVQQHSEEIDRTIKASRTNTITSTEFTVSAADRANKIFAFDSAGELSVTQELGTYRGNWATATAFAQRDIVKDTSNNNIYIVVTAHTSTGSLPISSNIDVAKWALLVDAAAATGGSFGDGTAAAPSIAHTGDLNTGLFFPAADTVAVSTAGTERMRIDAAGNVGIGSTAPSAKLEIAAAAAPDFCFLVGATLMTNFYASASGTALLTVPALPFIFGTSNTERMRIDAAGNISAGTGTTTISFDVGGNISIPAATTQSRVLEIGTGRTGDGNSIIDLIGDATYTDFGLRMIREDTGANANSNIQHRGTGGLFLTAQDAGVVVLSTTNTERMRITAIGNVGIGNAAPVTPLHVTGASMTTGVVYKAQPAETSKAAAATLTIAELLTGIIKYTGAAATLTLPTGTSIEGGLPATFPIDMSFDVSFINTGAGLLSIAGNGNTTTGTTTVATATSGRFRFRKTAVNTYTVYRIS